MTSPISSSGNLGEIPKEEVGIRIGMMGTDRDLSRFEYNQPVPATMSELKTQHPELYQEMLLQVFETMNKLLEKQLRDSEEHFKKVFNPDEQR